MLHTSIAETLQFFSQNLKRPIKLYQNSNLFKRLTA